MTFDLVSSLFSACHDPPPAPPTSLALSGTVVGGAKKRLAAPSLSVTLSRRDSHDPSHDGFSAAALSATPDDTPSLDINLEALETPSGSETGTLPDSTHELEWEGETGRERDIHQLTDNFFIIIIIRNIAIIKDTHIL